MFDRLRALIDPVFRRQRRVAYAVGRYMSAHRARVMKRVWAEHLAREVAANRQQADLSLPDIQVDNGYIDFAALVMLTALEQGAGGAGDSDRKPPEDDGAVEDHVGWATGMLQAVFGLGPGEAFNAVGAAVLRLPKGEIPDGMSADAHAATLDEADRIRLQICALAEQVGIRIGEGVARGDDAPEPSEEEVDRLAPLIEVTTVAPSVDGR